MRISKVVMWIIQVSMIQMEAGEIMTKINGGIQWNGEP